MLTPINVPIVQQLWYKIKKHKLMMTKNKKMQTIIQSESCTNDYGFFVHHEYRYIENDSKHVPEHTAQMGM